jgi:TrmH family RNA methyltransferase
MSPKTVRIYSENDDYQYLEALRRNRVKRQRAREFVVEGVRQLNQALANGWTINAYLYSPDRPLSDWAAGILARSRARTHLELPLPLLEKLSGKDEASELLALVAMPDDDLARIPLGEDLLAVIFDRPASPGNLGTVIRSCDALGVHGLVVTGHAADLYDPETISATTGSLFALPVVRAPAPGDLLPWFETIRRTIGPFQLVGSSARATVELTRHDFTRPTILVVGNETWGLSAAYRELCDAIVTIPIGGSATSLNVACAASILLYEVGRQRRAGTGG